MTRLFLDVETYSLGPKPTYDDRIIAIAYKQEGGPITVLKEWESDERQILNQFLEQMQQIDRPSIIGHNILRFDLPVVVNRASLHNLAATEDLMHLLLDSYPIDTLQAQLPANNFYFKGLSLAECAKRIDAETRTCPGAEIKTRYEQSDYTAIVEHVTEDVILTEKLFNHLAETGIEL